MNKKKKEKILIVDDELPIREFLEINFNETYETDTAGSVKEAAGKIETSKYALVITDMKMPGESGLDLIKLIKEKSPETMVIVVSGYSSVEDAVGALKLGADDYFRKPLELDKFNTVVKNLVEKYRLKKNLSGVQRLFELEKLNRKILESQDINETLPSVLDLICGMFNADSGSIMLFDKSSQKFFVFAARGQKPVEIEEYKATLEKSVFGCLAAIKRGVLPENNTEVLTSAMRSCRLPGKIKSSIIEPLAVHEKFIGVLNLNIFSKDKAFSEEDVESISMFSLSLALSMENARFKSELIESNERLKEIDKLKTELVSNVSHELRTPLTAMKGSLDLLLYHSAEPDEQTKKLLTIISNNLERQTKLVSELLDFSRLGSNTIKIEKKESDLISLINEVVEEMAPLFERSKLDLKMSLSKKSVLLNMDPDRIKQVMVNLLSNAIKYTKEGSVNIILEEKTESVIISIKDTGCGIPEDQRPRMFTRFFRVDNDVTRNTPGFGLGLSLTKVIVEAHGGQIWFECPKEGGSVFSFLLYK